MNLLNKVILIAVNAHINQLRKHEINGFRLPYITHPIEITKFLWKLGFGDEITLASAILHDAVEDNLDNPKILDNIKLLGIQEITNTVMDLSILSGTKAEYLKKFGLPSISPRSLVIKIVDRLCNVNDFMLTDHLYAKKYLDKASILSVGLVLKEKEIIKIWGQPAFSRLKEQWDLCHISAGK